jgi:hypothetical protein
VAARGRLISNGARALFYQAVVFEGLVEGRLFGIVHGGHGQAHFFGGHIEHGHRGFYGYGVCGQAEQVSAQGEEFLMPFEGGGEIAFED